MLISGKDLSTNIVKQIEVDLDKLSSKGIKPKIAIITVGPDTSWKTYVRRKVLLAKKLGIKKELINLKRSTDEILLELTTKLNNDSSVHGIIVQRPLSDNIDTEKVIDSICPEKDIDGFRQNSLFIPPIWLAVETILKKIADLENSNDFSRWLSKKSIVVIGKGETGGLPIINNLKKNGINPQVIDSKTKTKSKILKNTDIIISAVGQSKVVQSKFLKKGVILIGIGIFRGTDGKLHGDYSEIDIQKVAGYYTPTPGGVGPLNLSFLFKNLVDAAKRIQS